MLNLYQQLFPISYLPLSSKKYIIIEHDFKFIRGRNIPIWQTKVDQPKINAFVELYKNEFQKIQSKHFTNNCPGDESPPILK